MTVTSRKYFSDWFVANGVNKDWGFDFTILSQDDVIVQVRDGTDNTTIVDYTTDLGFYPADDFGSGTVRYPIVGAALAVGKQIRILREVAYFQPERIGKEGKFLPQTHEKALDRVTILTQQVDDNLERAVKVQIGVTAPELTADISDGAVLMKQGSLIVEGPNATSINSAQGFAEDAEQARDEARLWATKDEDVPVEGAEYSAKHWAAKSGASATAASLSAEAAADSAAEVATNYYNKTEVDALIQAGGVPIGASIPWNSLTPPTGFLKENGAAISRSAYPELFAAIGTQHGSGDGSTTFNVPDSRGVTVRGLDDGRGLDPGRVLGSYQADENKSHTHTGSTNTDAHSHSGVATSSTMVANASVTGPLRGSTGNIVYVFGSTGSDSHSHTLSINADGGSEARMKNTAKLYVIRAF